MKRYALVSSITGEDEPSELHVLNTVSGLVEVHGVRQPLSSGNGYSGGYDARSPLPGRRQFATFSLQYSSVWAFDKKTDDFIFTAGAKFESSSDKQWEVSPRREVDETEALLYLI